MSRRKASRGGNNSTRILSSKRSPQRKGTKTHNFSSRFFKSARLSASVGTPPLHICATTILKNSQGKYVKIIRKSKLELVVDELQGSAQGQKNVDIWKQDNHIALCFDRGGNKYLVTVNGNELKLVKTNDVAQAIKGSNSWFRRDNVEQGHNQYYIQTDNANSSPKYFVINEESSGSIALSDTRASTSCIFTTDPCVCNTVGCTGL